MEGEIHEAIGEHRADIAVIKVTLTKVETNQEKMMEFINEQKAGRKYVWIFLGSVAAIATFARDFLNGPSNFLTIKSLH